MKKIILSFCAAIISLTAVADEGIWLPSLIGERIGDMQSKGFKLSAEDIYSINQSSMKDGVMLFGGGCTAEIISDQGLVLTNHHCGYGAIQSHSTVEHDYLTDGFSAKTMEEELPNPSLNVRFLVRMEDVTAQVEAGETPKEIAKAATQQGRYRCSVEPLYYANQWFLFVYEQFDDVRLVAAPPSSIGKFGGDTDNWMWPRHTGDFSVFRIYANEKNEPAAYSAENVPYTPKHHFKISTKGVEEGDFTMIYGFPGTTQQYITSDAVEYIERVSDPMKIDLRTRRLDIISAAQALDPAVRIKYASKHASIANSWKKWQGEALGLKRLKTIEKKRAYEQEFTTWAASHPQYSSLLDSMSAAYKASIPAYYNYELCIESVRAIELGGALLRLSYPLNEERMKLFFKDYEESIDRDVAVAMLEELEARMESLPEEYLTLRKSHGTIEQYVDYIFDNSSLTSFEKLASVATSQEAVDKLKSDEPIAQLREIFAPYTATPLGRNLSDMAAISKWYAPYLKALREFDLERSFFPDANLTLRVAYGTVGGYIYRDGEYHKHLTTIDGIIAKDNPDIYDYDIPQSLRDLYATADYGRWGVEIDGRKSVPVCFLANNQTTGGNSGSPIINANGELVGLNFDRTWISTMSDIAFDPTFCRNISVDIRYVLFVLEEILDAKHLVGEMELVE
ncbi:MAG: S46 family peptidase [Rikenellaceae bacterium]